MALLARLHEPNDTRLGLSKTKPRGRAVGRGNAVKLFNALEKSAAAKTGLLQDLEDSALFIRGIGSDIVSDITTNIIRGQLIEYTQDMARVYGIETQPIPSGITWDGETRAWREQTIMNLPYAASQRLLLVPKAIVRKRLERDREDLYSHYLLDILAERELSTPNSELVYTLKSGEKRVNRTMLRGKYKNTKELVEAAVVEDPETYRRYKDARKLEPRGPLTNDELTITVEDRTPNLGDLLLAVTSCTPGADDFDRYEKALYNLLTALFSPGLTYGIPQQKLYQGLKRVDITYSNMDASGFFWWLSRSHPCGLIFIEAKNYGREVANPEFDQLAGRFSANAGRFGFLICRSLEDRPRAIERARSLALGKNEFCMPLTDDDLRALVEAYKAGPEALTGLLIEKWKEIAL